MPLDHIRITTTKGVIETKDLVYFVDLTVAFLVFSLLSLQSRRWRG